jgi:hypothetical protein
MGIWSEVRQLPAISRQWERDEPGNVIEFSGSRLVRTQGTAGRNPYLVIRVDGELIHDHNHGDPRMLSFIRQLVLHTDFDYEVRPQIPDRAAK